MKTAWSSERLIYTFCARADLTEIAGMLAKPTVCKWLFFGPNAPEATHAYFEPLIDGMAEDLAAGTRPKSNVFTVRTRPEPPGDGPEDKGGFVGQCALLGDDFSEGAYLIGYQLDDTQWRKGYGTEMFRFLVWFAFTIAGAYRLNGDCSSGNAASVKIMERCGFVLEGLQRKYWHVRSEKHDHLIYGLLAEDLPEGAAPWQELFSEYTLDK
ncbi:MAG: GNAT family N-acetyltransferase [Methanomicrobiaceae archaeon]|nr:GNAT family N-acetyltransferase [Methanomicrobiaceae archaeon]